MPGGGGEVRSYNLVRTAAEAFELTVLNIGGVSGAGRVPPELAAKCKRVIEPGDSVIPETQNRPASRIGAWGRFVCALLFPWRDHGRPFLSLLLQHGGQNDPRMAGRLVRLAFGFWSRILALMPMTCFLFDSAWRRIRDEALNVAEQERFDLVWVEHTLAWPFAEQVLITPRLKHLPVLCSGHNVEHRVCERQAIAEQHPQRRCYLDRQTELMRRMELRAWRRSQLILQCSTIDADLTRQLYPGANVAVIGNGVDGQYFHRSDHSESPSDTIVFTAGFGYQPNSEAVWWFLRDVFPRVRRAVPNVKFLFAGSEASRLAESLRTSADFSLEAVDWVSDPDDIRPSFQQGKVYVVPLLCGGGSRLKILEAMSMEVPVVSTTVGAEGVPYEHGRHLLLADGAEAFSAAVISLLNDADLRSKLAESAANFARDSWDWSALRGQLRSVLQEEFCK